MIRTLLSGVLAAAVWPVLHATPVAFDSVTATHSAGSAEEVRKTIDGRHASPEGWSVAPQFGKVQSAVFAAAEPIEADLLTLTLFFMSGRPNTSFARFSVSYTSDAKPDLDSRWESLPFINFGATTNRLRSNPDGSLEIDEVPLFVTGKIPDEVYWISARTGGRVITGLRVDVFPVVSRAHPKRGPRMSWSMNGDFLLTEFKAEVIATTTNVALGAAVTATHPLFVERGFDRMTPDALTDGWPSTIAHPEEDQFGKNFHFEIDLGRQRSLDHLGLRQRGDEYNLDRFGKMRLRLYQDNPESGAPPVWETLHRADGSYPPAGEVDILRVGDGTGDFRGRYLRISSENPVPLSPMLAELEAYETRTARLLETRADDRILPPGSPLRIPPGVQRLAFRLEIPHSGRPMDRLFRWRLRGVSESWRSGNSLYLEVPCPPAGESVLEVQAAHSDGEWDASLLSVPLAVKQSFTKSPIFFLLVAGSTLGLGGVIVWGIAQRRIAILRQQGALAAERERIARDMHDDVGARLSQLSFMLRAFHAEPGLPASAREEVGQLTEVIGEALGSLDEVVWTVNPKNDRLDRLCKHLVSLATGYLEPLGIRCRIDSPHSWPDHLASAQFRHQMTLAFKEALQNVVKHSGASEVMLTLLIQDRDLLVRVADNGRGLPPDAGERGRSGLDNLQARLASIGGECQVKPRPEGGTLVEMKVPIG